MRKRNRREEDHDHLDRWLISYSDFLTLMFTFFAALYALSNVDKEKVGQFSTSLKQAFNVIERPVAGVEDGKKPVLAEMRNSLANVEGISVKERPKGTRRDPFERYRIHVRISRYQRKNSSCP